MPFLNRHFGLELSLRIDKRGYHPRGGGQIVVLVPPVQGSIPSFTLNHRGAVVSIFFFE